MKGEIAVFTYEFVEKYIKDAGRTTHGTRHKIHDCRTAGPQDHKTA
jgi:hypothetical protein